MINEIDILKDSQGGDFGCCPGKEARWLLRIVPDHHELVVELREDGFYPFVKSFVSPCRWFPIILIQSIWNFKFDISRVKKDSAESAHSNNLCLRASCSHDTETAHL